MMHPWAVGRPSPQTPSARQLSVRIPHASSKHRGIGFHAMAAGLLVGGRVRGGSPAAAAFFRNRDRMTPIRAERGSLLGSACKSYRGVRRLQGVRTRRGRHGPSQAPNQPNCWIKPHTTTTTMKRAHTQFLHGRHGRTRLTTVQSRQAATQDFASIVANNQTLLLPAGVCQIHLPAVVSGNGCVKFLLQHLLPCLLPRPSRLVPGLVGGASRGLQRRAAGVQDAAAASSAQLLIGSHARTARWRRRRRLVRRLTRALLRWQRLQGPGPRVGLRCTTCRGQFAKPSAKGTTVSGPCSREPIGVTQQNILKAGACICLCHVRRTRGGNVLTTQW